MSTYSVPGTILGILCTLLVIYFYSSLIDLEIKAERWSNLSKLTQLAKSRATFELWQSEFRAWSLTPCVIYPTSCKRSIQLYQAYVFLHFAFSGNITLTEFSDVSWLLQYLEFFSNMNLCLYLMYTNFLLTVKKQQIRRL